MLLQFAHFLFSIFLQFQSLNESNRGRTKKEQKLLIQSEFDIDLPFDLYTESREDIKYPISSKVGLYNLDQDYD